MSIALWGRGRRGCIPYAYFVKTPSACKVATVYRLASKKPLSNSGCSSTAHVQLLRVSEWQQLAAAATAWSRPGSRAVASLQSPPTWHPPSLLPLSKTDRGRTSSDARQVIVSPGQMRDVTRTISPLPAGTLMEFCGRGNGPKMNSHEHTAGNGPFCPGASDTSLLIHRLPVLLRVRFLASLGNGLHLVEVTKPGGMK